MAEKIAVAVSGGADSFLSLVLLKEAGHEVLAVHGRFLREDEDGTRVEAGLAARCATLGVDFVAVDLRGEFARRVVAPFVASYFKGDTPNPCAHCNRHLKFGLLAARAGELGAKRFATGHYAGIVDDPEHGPLLARGRDASKDQSYFLALVPREALATTVFPLARTLKRHVKDELGRRGLEAPLPLESQEVCFVPGDDYRAFLEGYAATRGLTLPGPGPVETPDGQVIGRHQGLWRYTLGQRKGLGIAWSEPLYVAAKDTARGVLMAGPREAALTSECRAAPVNLFVPPERWPGEVFVKTRYRQEASPAHVALEGGGLCARFPAPHPRPAPGQVLAVYDTHGIVLAGGIII